MPPQFYLSCFVSGLKPEIRREVQAFQPISLSHAISLAKLQEEKHNDHPKTLATKTNWNPNRPPFHPPTTTAAITNTTTSSSQHKTPPPVKRLSPAELQARREKGLCYNCDECFHAGHRCKRQFHLLVALPETPDLPDDPLNQLLLESATPNPPDPNPPTETQLAQISLHALMGHPIPQTLRVLGLIAKQPIAVLIDGGSTNNFIQDRVCNTLLPRGHYT